MNAKEATIDAAVRLAAELQRDAVTLQSPAGFQTFGDWRGRSTWRTRCTD